MNTNSVQQISESRYSAESTIAKVAANSECEFQYYYRLDIAINQLKQHGLDLGYEFQYFIRRDERINTIKILLEEALYSNDGSYEVLSDELFELTGE